MGLIPLLIVLCGIATPSVAVRTELWKETTEITKPGALGTTVKGWKCNHCDLESWNRNPSRVQYHLTGDDKLRDAANGFSGVEVCTKVPEEIASAAKTEMSGKTGERDSQTKRSTAAAEMADADSEERAKTMKQTTLPNSPLLKIKADNSVSDFFDGTATPHNRVDSFLFRKMVEDIQAAGPG